MNNPAASLVADDGDPLTRGLNAARFGPLVEGLSQSLVEGNGYCDTFSEAWIIRKICRLPKIGVHPHHACVDG